VSADERIDYAGSAVLNPRAHVVYRLRGFTGCLLYVGCTNDFDRRLSEHRRLVPWFPLVHSADIERFPGPDAAFAAERQAIRDEHPLFNRVTFTTETAYEVEQLIPGAEHDDEIGWALDFIMGQAFDAVVDES